jgi:thiol-disulfide isomerase/thioredoxin
LFLFIFSINKYNKKKTIPPQNIKNKIKKNPRLVPAIAFLFIALMGLHATAEDKAEKGWADSQLGKTRLGEHWHGKKVDAKALQGRVVLIEFWGYRCPPCIRSLPHMEQLHKKYKSHGFVLIGAHAQGSQKSKALKVINKAGVTYTILSGATVPGLKFSGIPHAALFDMKGKMVWHGHPMSLKERDIVTLLRAVKAGGTASSSKERGARLIQNKTFSKELKYAVEALRQGQLGRAYSICEKKSVAKEKKEVSTQAKGLLAELNKDAAEQLKLADQASKKSFSKAYRILSWIKRDYAGSAIYKQAIAKGKEMKAKEYEAKKNKLEQSKAEKRKSKDK